MSLGDSMIGKSKVIVDSKLIRRYSNKVYMTMYKSVKNLSTTFLVGKNTTPPPNPYIWEKLGAQACLKQSDTSVDMTAWYGCPILLLPNTILLYRLYWYTALTNIECLWRFFSKHVESFLKGRRPERYTEIFISMVQLGADVIQSDVTVTITLANRPPVSNSMTIDDSLPQSL